jgi:hypothetical protein
MFWSPFERWLTDGIPQITERSATCCRRGTASSVMFPAAPLVTSPLPARVGVAQRCMQAPIRLPASPADTRCGTEGLGDGSSERMSTDGLDESRKGWILLRSRRDRCKQAHAIDRRIVNFTRKNAGMASCRQLDNDGCGV